MIWSRRPLRQVQVLPFLPLAPTGPASAPSYAMLSQASAPVACTLAETPFGPLLIYGTIITWPGDTGSQGDIVRGDAQSQAIDRQAADWTSLRAALRDIPLCVAGDLNVSLDGPMYPSSATREHLASALRQAGLRCLTASLSRQGDPAPPLVDHISLSAALPARPAAAELFEAPENPRSTSGRPVSDHPGVVVRWVG